MLIDVHSKYFFYILTSIIDKKQYLDQNNEYLLVMRESQEKVVSINKNREVEIDSLGFICKHLKTFPPLERDVLQLSLGLARHDEIVHTSDEIAEI